MFCLSLTCPHSCAAPNTAVKVALIADKAFNLHKSPLVSLLEVEISQRDGIQLLERVEIDKILQEQRLQLMFSARGVISCG